MKSKTFCLRLILISALALITAFSVSMLLGGSTARADEATDPLTYSDESKTVVTGIKDGVSSVEIPNTVVKIQSRAFLNKNLEEVTFEEGSVLEEIGDWAFAKTSITGIQLPESLQTIGAAAFGECENLVSVTLGNNLKTVGQSAFGNCANLNFVNLPENVAQIEFGEYVFNNGENAVYLITENRAHYDAVIGALEPDEETDEVSPLAEYVANVTYPVTINYYSGNVKLAEETRLYGTDYKVQLSLDGKWTGTEIDKVGTSSVSEMNWYYDSKIVNVDFLTSLLADGEGYKTGDWINLYTFDNGEMNFEPRTDVVFDENRVYATTELNDLLASSSDKVSSGMAVTITAYSDPDGNVGETPEVFYNAGTYGVNVLAGGADYTFEIVIARKTVDLGDYAQFSWRVNSETDLRDMNLYLYNGNGVVYPSNSPLTDDQIRLLGLDKNYSNKQVLYSVVRNSGSAVQIGIHESSAYTAEYTGGTREAGRVGEYTAYATVTANGNYLLKNSYESALRGLDIRVSEGGKTAEVSKTWYIVNVSNWLVTRSGANYSIGNYTYGATIIAEAPQLKYTSYDGSATTFYMELFLNGTKVGASFEPKDIADYINGSMPAGEYRLAVTVGEVISEEFAEDDTERLNPIYISHAGFAESFNFTVSKKALQSLQPLYDALNEKTFTYKWDDGKSHLWEQSEEVTNAYRIFLDGFLKPTRRGIWEGSAFNGYYGDPVLLYNLERMQSSDYFVSELVSTGSADTYKVYYKISAPNYYDSLELANSGSRTDYYFTVINIKEIALPVAASKTYNGELLTADVILPADDEGNPLYYTVSANEGGIDAGTYEVVLSLLDPEHYMWAGQTFENKTQEISVEFAIDKFHENYFTTTLGITTWVVGKYDELEGFPVAADVYFGKVVLTLSTSDDPENVLYNGENGTAEFAKVLSELEAGSYLLTATVDGSDNFNDISDFIIFRVFEKDGLPWWAVVLIVAGSLAVAALILFVLHQKGVLQMLTGKVVIAMRTKATVDATIAAVRANKVAAEAKKTVAKAEARDRLEALRTAQAQAKSKTAEEQAAALEEKAQAAAKSAEKLQKRANSMQKRADRIKRQAENQDANAQAEQTVASDGETASDNEQPKDEN